MSGGAQFALLMTITLGVALVLAKPLGRYLASVMSGTPIAILRFAVPLEKKLYRLCGIDPAQDTPWPRYATALLLFNLLGAMVVYGLQRLQAHLPLNPQRLPAVSPDSSFNTAISFVTNTDWQGYSPESTMGYLAQMAGLAVQNYLSAATGIVVAIALIRGFVRRSAGVDRLGVIGNCWVDLTRATLYLLLPLSMAFALVLASQGVVQNLDGYRQVAPLEAAGHAGASPRTKTLPMGPMASQEAIKELGTNGGGFLNANSAHPYENPTPLTNLCEMIAILLIPFAMVHAFGYLVGEPRQGWVLLAAMLILLVGLATLAYHAEQRGNPLVARLGVDQTASALQSGGNMEGKEVRFGIAGSALFAAITTATSCGAVNTMHDSLTPLGGLAALFLMQLGELAPGGVGTGLYTILVYAILGVFIAGLMIGRTPEYLGKKIEATEMKLASVFILITPFASLIGTAIAVSTEAGRAGVGNPGAHGFSEILYAFSSAANNNGSAFGGLSVNTPFYNLSLGITMWIGRFWPIVAVLALAGSLAAKKRVPVGEGTLPTSGPLFVVLLLGSILLIGALTYLPALALGPIVEHLTMTQSP